MKILLITLCPAPHWRIQQKYVLKGNTSLLHTQQIKQDRVAMVTQCTIVAAIRLAECESRSCRKIPALCRQLTYKNYKEYLKMCSPRCQAQLTDEGRHFQPLL